MASRHPSDLYRGASEPRVDPSRSEIPKSRTPWFIVVLGLFALATVVGMTVGFWRAANPLPAHELPAEAPPAPPAR